MNECWLVVFLKWLVEESGLTLILAVTITSELVTVDATPQWV